MTSYTIRSAHAEAAVVDEAAMLALCVFTLPDGRRFTPFAPAPWVGHSDLDPALSPYLRHLAAEFVCVPFGIGAYALDGSAEEWRDVPIEFHRVPEHGFTAGGCWSIVAQSKSSIKLRLDFPVDHPIAWAERTVTLDQQSAAIDFVLSIHSRRSSRQPIAVHPIFRLPESPGMLKICAVFRQGFTDPGASPAGAEALIPFQPFFSLDAIPLLAGGVADYTSFPHAKPIEAMLHLSGAQGAFELAYPAESAGVRLTWDREILPDCLMWASDGMFAPQLGVPPIRCIALEPMVAAFGLAPEVSLVPNPLTERGISTALQLDVAAPTVIRYRIEAFKLN